MRLMLEDRNNKTVSSSNEPVYTASDDVSVWEALLADNQIRPTFEPDYTTD